MPKAALLILAFFLGVAPAHVVAAEGAAADGLLVFPATAPVAETMDRLEAAVRARGFRVFARIDHAAGAASVGRSLRPTQLLVFGNPAGGTPLMEKAQTIDIDMPLKALVYEDAAGRAWIAFNDPAHLAARHHLPGAAPVIARMKALFEALSAAAGAPARDTPEP